MLTRLKEHRVRKPWGRTQVPQRFGSSHGEPLGEIWFQRDDVGREDALLVKYLFTSQRLSVQVHPDDDAATAAGHDRGKDEAWLILDVEPGAEIAIGLKKQLSTEALKASALDGSIVDRLDWREVAPGDAFYSPAGTLHAIGAGLTLLEVQQNADITYRFFDYGRDRELHLDEAVAVANTASSPKRSIEQPLSDGRSLLVQGPKFTVERWREGRGRLRASQAAPLWLITLTGPAHANGQKLDEASVWIADDEVHLELGPGSELLVAYEGSEIRAFL
jgi:mannose-6-phosphate isomerase